MTGTGTQSYKEMIDEMVVLVNESRIAAGVLPLNTNPMLTEAAMLRASEIVTIFAQQRPNGTYFNTALDEFNIPYASAAENIARGYDSADSVFKMWKRSASHWKSIMNPKYTHIGVGVTYAPDSTYKWYWVQIFIKCKEGSMPDLWIQPSRPLIHVYGTKAVRDSDFDSNGYAIFEPISAEVYQEQNGEYSATFETHCDRFKKFMYIRKQALVKVPIKYHGKVRQQIFRIIDTVRKMNSDGTYRISAQAVHLFYGNNRFLIRSSHPTQMTGADALPYIANHSTYNTEAYPYICTSDIRLTRTAYYDNMSITEALLGADQAFVNRWGGKLYRDNFYYSINRETEGYQTAGVIEYGYNLTDIEFEEDDTDIITDLIAEDNFGNKYHASVPDNELTVPHRIFKYETFSYDVESISTFHADAEAYLEEYKQSTVSITVNFLNLSNLDKYKQFRSLDSYEVGDKVILYHKDLDIYYSNLEIISKRYDVLSQKTLEIEIGRFKNAISRRPFMSETASGGQSVADKQNAAIQGEIRDTKLKMLSSWRGARAFTWREISKFTWKEVSKNDSENNES